MSHTRHIGGITLLSEVAKYARLVKEAGIKVDG